MSDMKQDLENLRQAAERRDPEQCQFLLKKLFMGMEFFIAFAVVVERAQVYLETFEHQYPDAKFARQILIQMVNTGVAPAKLPPEALRDFEKPGAANYMKALADMAFALQNGALPPRIGYLVSSIVNAIMAELVEHYYSVHMEDWTFQRENPSDPKIGQVAYEFWTDSDVALLDTDAWMLVADSIEKKMERR